MEVLRPRKVSVERSSFLGGVSLIRPFPLLFPRYTPERLPMCMLGAFLTVIGLFIFAFTSYASVHWSGPVVGSVFFGAGVLLIYAGVFTYTSSCWKPVAASAMAANSLVRSSFAAALPLFTTPMYEAMGTDGATALLASLNVLMIPIPFVLYKYGARIRARSSYTMQP